MGVLNNRGIDFRIDVHFSEIVLPGLQALLAKGFLVQTRMGGTLSDLLCGQLGIDSDYLKHRVQTLFLNSSPVDDTEKTIVTDGDVVALSAAMPGLVGATLRKGGFYARLRNGISHQIKDAEKIEEHTGIVTIRLFNVVAKELGPVFMEKGVMVDGGAMQSFLKTAAPVLTSSVYTLIVDGEETAMPVLLEKDWHMRMIRLTIQTVGDKKG